MAAGAIPVWSRREPAGLGCGSFDCRPAPAPSSFAKGTGRTPLGGLPAASELLGTVGPALRSGKPRLDSLAPRRWLGAGGLGIGLWDGSGRLGDPQGTQGTGGRNPGKAVRGAAGIAAHLCRPAGVRRRSPGEREPVWTLGSGGCLRRPAVGGDRAGLFGDFP